MVLKKPTPTTRQSAPPTKAAPPPPPPADDERADIVPTDVVPHAPAVLHDIDVATFGSSAAADDDPGGSASGLTDRLTGVRARLSTDALLDQSARDDAARDGDARVGKGSIAAGGAGGGTDTVTSGHPGAYGIKTNHDGEVTGHYATVHPGATEVVGERWEYRDYEREMTDAAAEAQQRREAEEAANPPAPPPATQSVQNADGSTTTTSTTDGTAITTFSDGTQRVDNADGSVEYFDATGNPTTAEHVNTTPAAGGGNPDGDATGDPDEIVNDDGSVTTVDEDTGDITTVSSDGTTEINHADGTTEIFHPDGSHTEVYADGSSTTVDKDGNVTETPPPEEGEDEETEDSDDDEEDEGEEDEGEGEEAEEEDEGGGTESQPVDDYIPPDVSRIRDVAKAFGLDPDNPRVFTGSGDVDPADDSQTVDLESGPIRDLKRELLGDPVDPDDELDSDRPIPTTIGRNGGFTDPAADDDLLGALGPEADPFADAAPGLEPHADRGDTDRDSFATIPTFDDIEFELPEPAFPVDDARPLFGDFDGGD